jgi:hypothetical protein
MFFFVLVQPHFQLIDSHISKKNLNIEQSKFLHALGLPARAPPIASEKTQNTPAWLSCPN